ncbi:MAG: hypothetical protein Q9181_003492 [Wetmoreana brouardii]
MNLASYYILGWEPAPNWEPSVYAPEGRSQANRCLDFGEEPEESSWIDPDAIQTEGSDLGLGLQRVGKLYMGSESMVELADEETGVSE